MMIKNFAVPLFVTLVLSLLIIYILHPLNKGAVALVFILCAGFISLIRFVIRSRGKKTGNESKNL